MSEPMVAKVHVEDMHVFFDLMTLKLDGFGHHNRLLVWFVCDLCLQKYNILPGGGNNMQLL